MQIPSRTQSLIIPCKTGSKILERDLHKDDIGLAIIMVLSGPAAARPLLGGTISDLTRSEAVIVVVVMAVVVRSYPGVKSGAVFVLQVLAWVLVLPPSRTRLRVDVSSSPHPPMPRTGIVALRSSTAPRSTTPTTLEATSAKGCGPLTLTSPTDTDSRPGPACLTRTSYTES